MEQAKWRFAPNGNAGYTGINDSGIETFSARVMHSLVRETIQNALDARKDESEPITVEFKEFEMLAKDFPDYEGFSESIHACLRDNEDDDANAFFKRAVEIIDGKQNQVIRVLRISDRNTIGLQGAVTGEKGSNWSRLIKERGSSNKNKTAQGSFGIGKSAPFACSDLRTVFYSSLCEEKNGSRVSSNIGVARLISFKDKRFKTDTEDGWTTGTGFYSDNNKLNAILQAANFDPKYHRDTTGTDIYIMGFIPVENFADEVKKYVLLNFLVSIWNGMLSVNINGEEINRENLQVYIRGLNAEDGKDIKYLKDYYDLLVRSDSGVKVISLNADEYGKEYGFDNGECELRLKEGQGLNSRILLTRKSGMRLFEQDRISSSIEFTGVLLMTGPHMNAAFRALEVPSHDAWAPDRLKEIKKKKQAEKMLKGFRKYMRDCVRNTFGNTDVEQLNAFGMAEFLPDDLNNTNKNDAKETMGGDIAEIREKEINVAKPKARSIEKTKTNGGGTGAAVKVSTHTHEGTSGKKNNTGTDGDEIETYKYKEIPIQARVRSADPRKGQCYIEYIAPKKIKRAKLVLLITNERGVSNNSLTIKSANLLVGNGHIDSCHGNEIFLTDIAKGERVRIQCDVNIDRYCMMEAVYYEAKK